MTQPLVGKQILIVEDEKIIAMELEQQIKQLGYAVIGPVASGDAAIKNAEIARPDLVLMDIQLPGINGIEAFRQLRADARTAAIPVVAVTASVTPVVSSPGRPSFAPPQAPRPRKTAS